MMRRLLMAVCVLALAGCSEMESTQPMVSSPAPAAKLKDGDMAVPAGYKSWPKFLSGVDKEQQKQVRDIYINKVGAQTSAGQSFPNGSIMVMEIYKAKEKADGSLEKTPDGKLVKGDLAKVFIMGKDAGWGQDVPDNVKTGNWIYTAAGPDGKLLTGEDFNKCRGCHVPAASKDFVLRYDEYFEKRGQM